MINLSFVMIKGGLGLMLPGKFEGDVICMPRSFRLVRGTAVHLFDSAKLHTSDEISGCFSPCGNWLAVWKFDLTCRGFLFKRSKLFAWQIRS